MALYLIVKSGDSEGETYLLTPGLIIGRRGAQVRLADPKVSSQHAVIEEGPKGLILKDLDSKNGIVTGGEKFTSLQLHAGLEFFIGDTRFQVVELGASIPEASPAPPKRAPASKGKRWNEVLTSYLKKIQPEIKNDPKRLTPFSPALVLRFTKGPQAGTEWVLGYGPRRVGRKSVDLPILEASASETCFFLRPGTEGVEIKAVGKEVLLNGKAVSTETLKRGDCIQILGTELKVDFIE